MEWFRGQRRYFKNLPWTKLSFMRRFLIWGKVFFLSGRYIRSEQINTVTNVCHSVVWTNVLCDSNLSSSIFSKLFQFKLICWYLIRIKKENWINIFSSWNFSMVYDFPDCRKNFSGRSGIFSFWHHIYVVTWNVKTYVSHPLKCRMCQNWLKWCSDTPPPPPPLNYNLTFWT